jgi:hypothetical protein
LAVVRKQEKLGYYSKTRKTWLLFKVFKQQENWLLFKLIKINVLQTEI